MNFFGVLTLIFVTLKLTNYIDWSWWLVLLPLYGGFVLVWGVFLATLLLATLSGAKLRVTRRK